MRTALTWPRLAMPGRRWRTRRYWREDFKISRIVIDEPSVNLVREADGTLNLLKLLPPAKEKTPPPEPKEKETKKIHVVLRELALDGGKDKHDRQVRPGRV